MPGAGTSPGIMSADRPARILDVTRLLSRVGRGPLTGVDRVELAYLHALSAREEPLVLLARTAYGYLLLPKSAGRELEAWLADPAKLPSPGLLDRLRRRLGPVARAEAGLRAMAVGRAPHWRLTALVTRGLPKGGTYLNVGLSGLTERALSQLRSVPGLNLTVMIHDTIPLDHPEFSREGEPAAFRAKLLAVARHADLVVTPSRATAEDVRRWCEAVAGSSPRVLAAPIGVEVTRSDLDAVPEGLDPKQPYFVAMGTIEPRKNHALLLDVWEELGPDAPLLLLLGSRGWNNADVFARLDRIAAAAGPVRELPGLGDGAVAALLSGARALLMPSRAEGFGLPVAEAMALGVPVVAADLPVYREFARDYPVYLDPSDVYSWKTTIREKAAKAGVTAAGDRQGDVPSWADHFNLVLGKT